MPLDRLKDRLGELVSGSTLFRGDASVTVPAERIVEVLTTLRDDPEFSFSMLLDLTAVDRRPAKGGFEMVYHLTSPAAGAVLRVKASLPAEAPSCPTAVAVYPGAAWLERELYDMFGILFTGHPDLRRMLLPDDWRGHPLRKDYPLEGER